MLFIRSLQLKSSHAWGTWKPFIPSDWRVLTSGLQVLVHSSLLLREGFKIDFLKQTKGKRSERGSELAVHAVHAAYLSWSAALKTSNSVSRLRVCRAGVAC